MLRDPPVRRRRRGSPPDPRPAGPPEGSQGDCRRRRYGGRPAERRRGPREGPGDRRADVGRLRGELRWAGGAARHDELVRARGRGREHRQRLRGRLPGQHDEPLNSIRSEHAHVDQGESDRDDPQIGGLIPGPYLGPVERHDRDHVEAGEEGVHGRGMDEIQDDQGASETGGPGHHGEEPRKEHAGNDEVRHGTGGTDPAILLFRDGPGNPGSAWSSIEESDGGGEDEREYEAARVVPELGPEAVALSDDLVHDLMETHAGADGEERSWEENGEEDRRTPGESHQVGTDVQDREGGAEGEDGHSELDQFRAAEMHPRLRSVRIDVDRRCRVFGVGSPHPCPVTVRPYLGLRSVGQAKRAPQYPHSSAVWSTATSHNGQRYLPDSAFFITCARISRAVRSRKCGKSSVRIRSTDVTSNPLPRHAST